MDNWRAVGLATFIACLVLHLLRETYVLYLIFLEATTVGWGCDALHVRFRFPGVDEVENTFLTVFTAFYFILYFIDVYVKRKNKQTVVVNFFYSSFVFHPYP